MFRVQILVLVRKFAAPRVRTPVGAAFAYILKQRR